MWVPEKKQKVKIYSMQLNALTGNRTLVSSSRYMATVVYIMEVIYRLIYEGLR